MTAGGKESKINHDRRSAAKNDCEVFLCGDEFEVTAPIIFMRTLDAKVGCDSQETCSVRALYAFCCR